MGQFDLVSSVSSHLRDWVEAGVDEIPYRIRHSDASQQPDPPTWTDLKSCEKTALACTDCSRSSLRQNVVFGEGSPTAHILFIAEAPGSAENQLGTPLSGPSGELFDRMLQAMGQSRNSVYVTYVVKCLGEGDRLEPESVEKCLRYVKAQVALIQPRAIVILGSAAMNTLCSQDSFERQRGSWTEWIGVPTLATHHPAALLRDPSLKKQSWEDLQKVMALVRESA